MEDFLSIGELPAAPAPGSPRTPPSRPPRSHPEEWIEIEVPPIVSEELFAAAVRRLADNRRFATRNTKAPSLLTGLVSCQRCGYAKLPELDPDEPAEAPLLPLPGLGRLALRGGTGVQRPADPR
ncbi:MAG: hypothetical protein C0498_03150 [Anaerolinea sp.]|nr:hypothetical protein [Anaerolinea sp.]